MFYMKKKTSFALNFHVANSRIYWFIVKIDLALIHTESKNFLPFRK